MYLLSVFHNESRSLLHFIINARDIFTDEGDCVKVFAGATIVGRVRNRSNVGQHCTAK